MKKPILLFVVAASAVLLITGCNKPSAFAQSPQSVARPGKTGLSFAITVPAGRLPATTRGRLMVIVAPGGQQEDLRDRLDDVEASRSGLSLGTDATVGPKGAVVKVTAPARNVRLFPLDVLKNLPAGTYQVQAAFAWNPDLRDTNAPGNLFSRPQAITLPVSGPVSLTLSEVEPKKGIPADTDRTRFLALPSPRLTKFYGRPISLYAGVVLPSDYVENPAKPYPLCVRIGGFHTRYTAALRGRPYPGIVQLFVDGDGPFGDSYSVDSAVSGPYGAATIRELLPAVEKRFHCGGSVMNRFTNGGSTGGWVSLALQVYYPDTFGGCWSGFPDPLDFRAYQATDLTKDANAYLTASGSEQVSCRDVFTGAAKWTVREECALENVRGFGGSYVTSGGQWGVWNAVFGRRARDGRAVPFWDPVTGKIDRAEVDAAGKQYDLRRYCAANWKVLGPKLDGKIHLWVGERDDYFLNGGVHRFDDFLKSASPKIQARVEYSPVGGHGWSPRPQSAVLDEMIATAGK